MMSFLRARVRYFHEEWPFYAFDLFIILVSVFGVPNK
jgi:hypothetical protein